LCYLVLNKLSPNFCMKVAGLFVLPCDNTLVVFSLCHKISRWCNETGCDSDLSFLLIVNYYLIHYNKYYIYYTPATVYQHCKRGEKPWNGTKECAKLNSVSLKIKFEFSAVTGSNQYKNSYQLQQRSYWVSYQDFSICVCMLSFERHYPVHRNG